MGCCMSSMPPPIDVPKRLELGSITCTSSRTDRTQSHTFKSPQPKRYSRKTERILKLSYDTPTDVHYTSPKTPNPKEESKSKSNNSHHSSFTPEDTPNTDRTNTITPTTPTLTNTKSVWQLKMEDRKSELLRERQKIKQLQTQAFEKQVLAQQSQNFKGLYDIWCEFAHNSDGTRMDIHGLTEALKIFGMIIDTDRDFQKHIFKKFDIDHAKEIEYADFSATIASFVGSNTEDDALQTLFEIFDIENKGYLEIEDMARILLAQNQIAIVVTGTQGKCDKNGLGKTVYTKGQCLKQARRMVAQYDSKEFNDNKISFNEFKTMMNSRTESDMIISHMPKVSISCVELPSEQSQIPIFMPSDYDD